MNVYVILYGNIATISEDSDCYEDLVKEFPVENKSKEDIEAIIRGIVRNLPYDHYGKLLENLIIHYKIDY